ncbi:MAG TPA: ribosome maturation factor RimM [Thermodesulfobacteriota bacterium]|nr:ribosome maturation factor RimM [Thermodesulfobacteriota bacterium]
MGIIPFGRVLKVHGLSGEVRIFPFSREFHNLSRLKRVFIQRKQDERPSEFKIIRRGSCKGSAIVKLQGIDSIDAAEGLRGCLVMVDTSDLLEPEEGEYYWFQLIGLEVYTTDGLYVGRVESLMDRVSQSLLVVKKGKKESLIPMVDSIVKEISLKDSRIVVSPIKGLTD